VERFDVVIVGAGQAGLATSRELTATGVEHVVLERGRVGQTWRGRWETFCLVTPNWSVQLPGLPYDGSEPDGFMPRDDIVSYLERYADGVRAPVRAGVDVISLARADGDGYRLETDQGAIVAANVVIATGAYQKPHRPEGAGTLPPTIPQIDIEAYESPSRLPPGGVLIVGSGQSGCQIAEELHDAGRDVFLACGRAPWGPRRIGGRDIFWWALETGFMDQRVDQLPSPAARLIANILATGHGGGRDLHLRTLRAAGVTLLGHFQGCDGHRVRFADDLAATVAWGDARHREFMTMVRNFAVGRGLPVPDVGEPAQFNGAAPAELDIERLGVVMFAGGFRPDYRRWILVDGAFDDLGFPVQVDGASVTAPGLYFVGVHFLRKRKSSLLCGVGEDAAVVARSIASRRSGRTTS
jgi:putative flavoprotein involved in K+ transport